MGIEDTLGAPVGWLDGLIEGDADGKADGASVGIVEGSSLCTFDGV